MGHWVIIVLGVGAVYFAVNLLVGGIALGVTELYVRRERRREKRPEEQAGRMEQRMRPSRN